MTAADLARPGPHQVLRGDLALVGLPGVLWAPATGRGLPAVAFGHGWMQPVTRYAWLLRHLASWGIVAAAPATQTGPLPSTQELAADLRTALDVCAGVRLGSGAVSVDPRRLAVGGHAIGGAAAVLAAADDSRVTAALLITPAETRPSSAEAAARVSVPGLVISAGRDRITPPTAHADLIAAAWAGPLRRRSLPKATHLGFTDGRHWSNLLLDGSSERASQRATMVLATAFLLQELTGADHRALLDGKLKATVIEEPAAA